MRLRLLTALGTAGLTLLTGPGVAQARTAPGVPVPQHTISSTLTLLGASSQGVIVEQSAPSDDFRDQRRYYSGAEGTELGRRPEIQVSPSDFQWPRVIGVVGEAVGWVSASRSGGGRFDSTVHRMNIRTGKDVLDGDMPDPQGFTGRAWLTYRQENYNEWPFPPPMLKLYQHDLARDYPDYLGHRDVIPGTGDVVGQLAADETAAVQSVVVNTDLSQDDGAPRYSIELVDLIGKTKQTVVKLAPEVTLDVSLSPTTIAWSSRPAGGPVVIHQRPRAGGPITSYTDPSANADAEHLAVGDGSVGYLVLDPHNTVLRVVDAHGARTIDVPDGSAGIAAVGSRFLTAVGGFPDTAGVYSVEGTGPATRVATVAPRTALFTSVALTGSRIVYTDSSVPGRPSLWQRSITGNNRPVFGPESAVATVPAEDADLRPSSPISFSAGRGAVTTTHDWTWRLLDRGAETGVIPHSDKIKVSGPYVLSAGKVFGTEGNLLWTEPSTEGQHIVGDDIFGSAVIYAQQTDDEETTQIWTDDVDRPNPTLVATISRAPGCTGSAQVAIWGSTIAWDACSSAGVTVVDLVDREWRSIPATYGRTSPLTVVLGEGTLAWRDGVGTNVVDLTAKNLVPTVLPGDAESVLLDDHWIARKLSGPLGWPVGWDVQAVPFKSKNRPRLIGIAAPFGFTPNGDGEADLWRPQFDLTKPTRKVELTLTDLSSGRALRTLKATAPDGSIRDLSWDGRDKRGAALPIGTYRWTLTGRAEDGDGTLIGRDGHGSVTGTIEINATG